MLTKLSHNLFCIALVLCMFVANAANAQLLTPLVGFGGADGWLSPDESFLSTDNTQRGMTYSSATNHVYVVDRNGGLNIRILSGDTGAEVGTLDTTGISGGTFTANMIDVDDQGVIYAANLGINANFKVYRWDSEGAVPTVAFDAAPGLPRVGDSFAVIGSGADTRMVASGGGSDGVIVLDTVDGSNFTGSAISPVVGAPVGSFRLGIDFVDSTSIVGKQTISDIYLADLASGAVVSSGPTSVAGEAPLAVGRTEGLLALIDINSNAVRLYDADLNVLTMGNNTSSVVGNGNGVGDLKFGVGPGGSLRLYALNTNNGIQAFEVVPEPAFGLLAILSGLGFLAARRG